MDSAARFCPVCGSPRWTPPQPEAGPDPVDATRPIDLPPPPPTAAPGLPPPSWPAPVPPGNPPTITSPSRLRRLVPAAVVVVLVVIAAAVVLPRLGGGSDDTGSLRAVGGPARLPLPAGQVTEPERSWSVDVPLTDRSSVVVRDERFFAVETADDGISLVARSMADGKEEWSEDLPDEGVLVPDEEHLLVQLVGDGSDPGELRSYDKGSGDLRWKAGAAAFASVARHGDRVVSEASDEVVAYRVDNGKEAWSESTSGVRYAVDGDRVFVTDGERVRAVALDDGEEVWTTDLSGDVTALVSSDDHVLVAVDGEIIGLAHDDGKQTWRADLGTGPVSNTQIQSTSGLNALDGSTVVVVGPDDAVAIDAATGKKRGDGFEVDGDDWQGTGYQLPDGNVVMYDFARLITTVLDGDDGSNRRRLDAYFGTIARGFLYDAGSGEDELVAVDLDDLDEAWKVEIEGLDQAFAGDDLIIVQTAGGYQLWT